MLIIADAMKCDCGHHILVLFHFHNNNNICIVIANGQKKNEKIKTKRSIFVQACFCSRISFPIILHVHFVITTIDKFFFCFFHHFYFNVEFSILDNKITNKINRV